MVVSSAAITAIIAALVPLIVAITSLVVAIKAKKGAGPAGAAAGVQAVTEHLATPGSAVRALIAKAARSVASDHVQTLVQGIGLPFMPHAQEHQPLPVVPDEQPPLIDLPSPATDEQKSAGEAYLMGPPPTDPKP